MIPRKKRTKKVERRTYIKGQLNGQYRGILNTGKSAGMTELYYDLELMRGEIRIAESDITTWQVLDESQFAEHEFLALTLPESMLCHIERSTERELFHLDLQGVRIVDAHLSGRQVEGNEVYGDIRAWIYAYIVHQDTVPLTEEEMEAEAAKLPPKRKIVSPRTAVQIRKLAPGRRRKSQSPSRWDKVWELVPYFMGLWFLVPIVYIGFHIIGPLFLVVAGLLLLRWLVHKATNRNPVFWSVLGVIFALIFLSQVLSWLKSDVLIPKSTASDRRAIEEENRPKKDPLKTEFLVSGKYQRHRLHWLDYHQREYEGEVYVRTRDWVKSKNFRNDLPVIVYGMEEYNEVLWELYTFNSRGLEGVYELFDSIQMRHQLSETQFAEMIVSCVQFIPYTLIVDSSCNAEDYIDSPQIYDYLNKPDSRCIEQVKYGLFGPIEFVASLYGDCDTRTLLLFTLLRHYGYRTVILSSPVLGHSILGIDLPYAGAHKRFQGKRYVFWETTSTGFHPGQFPGYGSDERLWHVSLL